MRHPAICTASLFALSACFAGEQPSTPQASLVRADSAIYALLLDSLGPAAPITYISRQVARPASREHDPKRTAEWAAARLGTDGQFLRAIDDSTLGASLETILGAIPGVVWFGATVPAGITSRVPNSRVVTLSRIAYSSDLIRAAVYATVWCGGFCGYGGYYLFERDALGRWRLIANVSTFDI